MPITLSFLRSTIRLAGVVVERREKREERRDHIQLVARVTSDHIFKRLVRAATSFLRVFGTCGTGVGLHRPPSPRNRRVAA